MTGPSLEALEKVVIDLCEKIEEKELTEHEVEILANVGFAAVAEFRITVDKALAKIKHENNHI